jgi:hypothetical protein
LHTLRKFLRGEFKIARDSTLMGESE